MNFRCAPGELRNKTFSGRVVNILVTSAPARGLLSKAISGTDCVSRTRPRDRTSRFVAFVPGRWLDTNAAKRAAYVVLIDFTDFKHVVGATGWPGISPPWVEFPRLL